MRSERQSGDLPVQTDVVKSVNSLLGDLDLGVTVGAVGSVDKGLSLGRNRSSSVGDSSGDRGQRDLLGGSGLALGDLVGVRRVCVVKRTEVGSDGPRAIDGRVLGGQVGLVEVPGVGNVGAVDGCN